MSIPYVSQEALETTLRPLPIDHAATRAAIELARTVHGAQRRKGGGPYLEEHVFPITVAVAGYLSSRGSDQLQPALLTALLHDIIEDSDSVDRQTIELRFGPLVAEWVDRLTKPAKAAPGQPSPPDAEQRYLAGVLAAPFSVRLVKVMDRLNNLQAVHERPPDEQRRYLRESREHYLALADGVDAELADQMRDLIERRLAELDG